MHIAHKVCRAPAALRSAAQRTPNGSGWLRLAAVSCGQQESAATDRNWQPLIAAWAIEQLAQALV
jgi:hypothetical protein